MPNALVSVRSDRLHGIGEELQDPVEVMRAPVVDRAAGDGLMAVPVAAGVRVAADERLHVEDLTDSAGADYAAKRDEVRIPPPALEDSQNPVADGRLVDHAIDVFDSQGEWLLADHVLACLERREHSIGMNSWRGADDHQAGIRVVEEVARLRVNRDGPVARRQLPALGGRVAHSAQTK